MSAGPVPLPRKKAPAKMPIPPPTSSSGREFAAALLRLDEGEAGAHAEDPRGDQLGDAPAKVEMNRTERAMIPSPTRTGSLTPTRSESRPATGERMA